MRPRCEGRFSKIARRSGRVIAWADAFRGTIGVPTCVCTFHIERPYNRARVRHVISLRRDAVGVASG